MCCWLPSCACPLCGPVLWRARAWWRRSARGCCGGWGWCALRQGSARRRCWPTGRGLADGRWRGLAASQAVLEASSRFRALQALALAAHGDHTAALDALAKALTLARPQGHVRVFADEDAPMRALLRAAQR